LPTNNNGDKKVLVNGEETAPINKHKLPPEVDWQELARKKREEQGEGE